MLALGGQAVIEGVMIKSPRYVTVAVRKGKSIKVKSTRFRSLAERNRIFGWPIIRGFAVFVEMLGAGFKALNYSAEQAGEGKRMNRNETLIATAIAVIMGLFLFVWLPYGLTSLMGLSERDSPLAFNLFDGIIKLAIFIIYIYLISLMDDVKRIFAYHGAEHKTVHCYEAGKKLTVTNVKRFSPIHLRCGTSFVLTVILISVALFSLIPFAVKAIWPGVYGLSTLPRLGSMLLIRMIALMPIIAVSYEVLRASSKAQDSILTRTISYPGRLIQKLTTREPDNSQIEVAIASVNEALRREGVSS